MVLEERREVIKTEKIPGVYPSVEIESFDGYPELTKVTIGADDAGLATIVVYPVSVRYDQYDQGTPRLVVEIGGRKIMRTT